jgi:SAM-dependent methyltransferase
LYKKNIPPGSFSQKVFSARRTPDKIHYRMVQCKKDGQVRSHPIIKPTLLYSLYKKSSFTYQNELPNLTNTYVKALLPTLEKVGKNAHILEVGCGNGFVLTDLFKKGYKNVYGIDPSIDAKKAADKHIGKRIKLGILKNHSYKRDSFDVICLFQTLDHIPNPAAFLNLCKSFLKPGGYLIAFNHNVESVSARLLGERSPIIDIEHIYLFSKITIRVLFENQGYDVIQIYNPWNTLSLSHLVHLLPLPSFIKNRLQSVKSLTNLSLTLPLGNLCIVGQKKK